jgi:hypothetical protein
MPTKDCGAEEEILPVELSPDPVIEAYKKDVDRTLLRENLKLTVEQRMQKLAEMAGFMEELHKGLRKARA